MKNKNSLLPLSQPSKRDVFILDIDSTLVTTHQRNQRILQDWVQSHQETYPKDCEALKQAQCQFGDYGLKSALQRINFQPSHSETQTSLDEFWRKHFFSNHYLNQDIATRGAVHWVQDLEENGNEFIYLTARHKDTMWDGTLSSLDQLGFPISENNLFLKEDLSDSDEIFKTKKMAELLSQFDGRPVWLIDNEPVVLNQIAQDHPSVHLVWFISTHSGRMTAPPQALEIRDFNFS